MKWWRLVALGVGLAAGLIWLIFGPVYFLSTRSYPLLFEGLLVGGAVVISVALAWRWPILGGILLIIEGITPIILLFLMARGFPAYVSVFAGMVFLSGVIFVTARQKAGTSP